MAAKDKDDDMEEMEKLKAQLSALQTKLDAVLAENATLSAKLKAFDEEDEEEEAKAKATAAVAATLRDEVRTITGKTDVKEGIGVLRSIALKAKTADEATSRLKEIEADGRDKEFVALLDGAFTAGKISPAQRKEFWEKQCRGEDKRVTVEGLAMLKDFIKTAPVQVNLVESAKKDGTGVAHTTDEKVIMSRFGLSDPEEVKRFDEFRAAQQ